MDLRELIAFIAIVAPVLHIASDVMEIAGDGFSLAQLVINYIAFLLIPFLMIGLYSIQCPRIHWLSLMGAFLYCGSFIYFAHTTLLALEEAIKSYEILWFRLGRAYSSES